MVKYCIVWKCRRRNTIFFIYFFTGSHYLSLYCAVISLSSLYYISPLYFCTVFYISIVYLYYILSLHYAVPSLHCLSLHCILSLHYAVPSLHCISVSYSIFPLCISSLYALFIAYLSAFYLSPTYLYCTFLSLHCVSLYLFTLLSYLYITHRFTVSFLADYPFTNPRRDVSRMNGNINQV